MLRVAYATDPKFRRDVPSTPAAHLGTACHRVLELAGSGRLGRRDNPAWRVGFEKAWEQAISAEQASARDHPLEKHWPPAERWPGYAIRKVQTRRLAEQLSLIPEIAAEKEEKGSRAEFEQERQGFDRKLRGRPDVVRYGAHGKVIEDYKTGSLLESDTGEVKAAYKLQVLLYAALEHESTGEFPQTAQLIPLEGEPVSIMINEEVALSEAQGVVALLDEYNGQLKSKRPQELAAPSPDHCQFCPYTARCPGFWFAIDRSWADKGIVAVAGEISASQASRFNTFDLDCDAEAGSMPDGPIRLHGLDLDRFAPALSAEPETPFGAIGLREGTADDIALCTVRTRLVIESRHLDQ